MILNETADVFRPVQYLGSKLRSLAPIRRVVTNNTSAGSTVWEPFTGSSVVGQGLADEGMRVVAHDALTSSATFAQAMLGIHRAPAETDASNLHHLLEALPKVDASPLDKFLEREDDAVARGDGAALLLLGREIPQRWRSGVGGLAAGSIRANGGFLSTTYAGTYFSLRQALELEEIRRQIDGWVGDAEVSTWQRSVLLTALCAAASKAVFSAGKHFAQPLAANDGKSQVFHERRIVTDRRIDIKLEMGSALGRIYEAARAADEGHQAGVALAEDATSEDLLRDNVTVVYADPPYTAQQYSRFYHVLEVLVSGEAAKLQHYRGAVTRGLYPEGRYKSPFCSRVKAPGAFRHLAETSFDAGARLVISYSGSAESSTGNPRSISMEDLLAEMTRVFPRVSVQDLDLNYRQFNSAASANSGRDDPEVLIVAENNAE